MPRSNPSRARAGSLNTPGSGIVATPMAWGLSTPTMAYQARSPSTVGRNTIWSSKGESWPTSISSVQSPHIKGDQVTDSAVSTVGIAAPVSSVEDPVQATRRGQSNIGAQ